MPPLLNERLCRNAAATTVPVCGRNAATSCHRFRVCPPARPGGEEETKHMANEVRMVSASGILGHGYPGACRARAVEPRTPMVGVDGGSPDPGPHYLGSGKTLNSALQMKRDIRFLLRGAIASNIPMMIGTCGGAGGEPHLQACAA